MQPLNIILPKSSYYWVGVLTPGGLRAFKVTNDLHCACGGSNATPCVHIDAVRAYLRLEGREVMPSAPPDIPEACPICAEPVRAEAGRWRCIASPGHYWQWRGEQSGVKAFLTQPHPAKSGAFYEQSIEEREAFLDAVSHQRHHYSPYR